MIDLLKLEAVAEQGNADPRLAFKNWLACWEYATNKNLKASARHAMHQMARIANHSEIAELIEQVEQLKIKTPAIRATPYFLRSANVFY